MEGRRISALPVCEVEERPWKVMSQPHCWSEATLRMFSGLSRAWTVMMEDAGLSKVAPTKWGWGGGAEGSKKPPGPGVRVGCGGSGAKHQAQAVRMDSDVSESSAGLASAAAVRARGGARGEGW